MIWALPKGRVFRSRFFMSGTTRAVANCEAKPVIKRAPLQTKFTELQLNYLPVK